MINDEKGKYNEFDFGEGFDDLNSCSATDCTGVEPIPPKNEEEEDAYKEIYNFSPPKLSDK